MAALASFPCDGVLCELSEDDRVARRAPELKQAAADELAFVTSLGGGGMFGPFAPWHAKVLPRH